MKGFMFSGVKLFIWVLGFVLVFAAASWAATPDPIKIMPLGDSITKGSRGTYKGYRGFLKDKLNAAGYEGSYWFVGSKGAGWWHHEGHSGYHAADHPDPDGCVDDCEIEINVYDWLDDDPDDLDDPANPADVVLLHIGTNDLEDGQSPAGVATEVERILGEIYDWEVDSGNDVWVILARIINRVDHTCPNGSTVTTFNENLEAMAQARIDLGHKIVMVDMECGAGLDYAKDNGDPPYDDGDMYDNLHPNDSGYEKMATKWFEVLDDALFYMFEVGVFDMALTQDAASGELACSYALGTEADTAAVAWYKGTSPLSPSPIMTLFLPMEGGAVNALLDYSGNDVTVSTNGNPTWDSTADQDGQGAFEFGGDDGLSGGENFPTNSSYTKTAWVYRTGSGSDGLNSIISGDASSGGHTLRASDINGNRLSAGHNGNWNAVEDSGELALDTWYFVAVTYDDASDTMTLYKNGIDVDTNTALTDDVTDATISIGSSGAASGGWHGTIDDVRIYPHALSPEQIDSLFMNGGDIIVSQETGTGEEWQCEVTPFSNAIAGEDAGETRASNTLIYEARATTDGDEDVDGSDLQLVLQSFNTASGDPDFDVRCDFNLDGLVDAEDLEIFAREFGDVP